MRCSRERTNREGSKSWDSWCCPDIFFLMIHLGNFFFNLSATLPLMHRPPLPTPSPQPWPPSFLLFWIHIRLHLPFSLSARDCFPERLPSMLRLMFLFLSRLRSSWKSSVTLWLVLADVSIKAHFHWLAWASPSLVSTSLWVSSLLFPTSIIGIASTLPFMARTYKGKQRKLTICVF